ncbi:MAG: hypothetical protein ACLFWB_08680 [Armatimonadota bacterium]
MVPHEAFGPEKGIASGWKLAADGAATLDFTRPKSRAEPRT